MNRKSYGNIPDDLKIRKTWVAYKLVPVENQKYKKVPINPKTGKKAKSNNSDTWSDFYTACEAEEKYGLDGIGIMFNDGLCGLDFDDCIVDGKPSDVAKDIVRTMKSYTEYSPSGNGVHILFWADYEDSCEYYKKNENIGLELYKNGRYFTVTGNTIKKVYPMKDCNEEVRIVRDKYMKRQAETTGASKPIQNTATINTSNSLSDDALIRKAMRAKNGEKFSKLWDGDWSDYGSQSQADQALCEILAFWTGGDEERIDKLFRKSGLYRNDKWERYDYRTNTIRKACGRCKNPYKPLSRINSEQRANVSHDFYTAKNKFQHNVFGDYILANYKIVKISNIMHVYKDGIYVRADEDAIAKITINILPELADYQRKEVYKYLKLKCHEEKILSSPNLIPFNSKIYDVNINKFFDYSSEHVFINKIPYDYKPNAIRQQSIISFMKKIADGDMNIIKLIFEFVGYCFYRRCIFRSFVIFTGNGGNGKTTLLNLILKLMGVENTCSLALQDLTDKFRVGALYGKFVNIADDISANYVPDTSLVKRLASGGRLNAERKFNDPFEFENLAKMFFAANELPKVNDKTRGFMSKILPIPLTHDFLNDPDYDPHLKDREWTHEEMEYFLKCAMGGLKRLFKQGDFTKPTAVLNELSEYENYNNPIKAFLEEYGDVDGKLTDDVFSDYAKWCADNNYKPQGKGMLSKWVNSLLGLKTATKRVGGGSKRHYEK